MSDCMYSILVAEEDRVVREFVADNLAADGYAVWRAASRAQALVLLCERTPDLLLVDVNGQTLELVDAIRGQRGVVGRINPEVAIVALSGHADELHRVRLLQRGADDVVGKPFSYPELRERVAAVLRRCYRERRGRVLRVGPVTVDLGSRGVDVAGRPVRLSRLEFELLRMLSVEPGRAFTREELMRGVWGAETFGRTRTLDSHFISSPDLAVGYVGWAFRPGRRRRFISSGADSALVTELSP